MDIQTRSEVKKKENEEEEEEEEGSPSHLQMVPITDVMFLASKPRKIFRSFSL